MLGLPLNTWPPCLVYILENMAKCNNFNLWNLLSSMCSAVCSLAKSIHLKHNGIFSSLSLKCHVSILRAAISFPWKYRRPIIRSSAQLYIHSIMKHRSARLLALFFSHRGKGMTEPVMSDLNTHGTLSVGWCLYSFLLCCFLGASVLH